MNLAELNKVAMAMVAPGKGILAADESTGTIGKRFDAIATANTEDNRRDYREMMFRTSEAMKSHISGVILYDETIWQKAKDGTPLVEIIKKAGALPGIKVDEGVKPLPNCPGEVVTIGLDKLADRLPKYYDQGARFAKWRAVIDIGAGIPSYACIHANAHALARYAALCQAAQIVPIVEPEVLMDGDHDIDGCEKITEWVLKETFQELYYDQGRARRHRAQAQHDRAGQGQQDAGHGRRSRRAHRESAEEPACRARCRASPSCPAGRPTKKPPPISTR